MTDATPGDFARTPGGDPVFEHQVPDELATTAPRDEVRRRACEAHLREFLGDDFTVLTEKISAGIHLDLYVFAPSETVPHATLVTSGMSDLPMTLPDGSPSAHRAELIMGVPAGWPGIDPLDADLLADDQNFWPIKLIKDIARIPSTYDSLVAWGHTIVDQDEALFAPGLPFSGAIVGPPIGYPPAIMRASTPAGDVDHLAVLPTTPDEMDFKVAVPGGGDVLIDRLMEAGVTAVIDPTRSGVVDGPPPWSVHVLMTREPAHLGEVLDEVLPNRAAILAQERALEDVIPDTGEDRVRWRVSGPITPTQLSTDTDSSPNADEVRAAVTSHRGVVTLTPLHAGEGDQVMSVMASVMMLASRPDVAAIWLPHQQHVTTAAQFLADADGEAILTFRVRPTEASEGQNAVITHGFAAIGGREVLLSDPDMSHEDLVKRVTSAFKRADVNLGCAPTAGLRLKYGFSSYELQEAVDPVSGAPVLEMSTPQKKGRGLFGRRR